MKKLVTDSDLRKLGACRRDRTIFRRTFPDGAEINLPTLKKAEDAGLNWEWMLYAAVDDPEKWGEYHAKLRKLDEQFDTKKLSYDQWVHEQNKLKLALLRTGYRTE